MCFVLLFVLCCFCSGSFLELIDKKIPMAALPQESSCCLIQKQKDPIMQQRGTFGPSDVAELLIPVVPHNRSCSLGLMGGIEHDASDGS